MQKLPQHLRSAYDNLKMLNSQQAKFYHINWDTVKRAKLGGNVRVSVLEKMFKLNR